MASRSADEVSTAPGRADAVGSSDNNKSKRRAKRMPCNARCVMVPAGGAGPEAAVEVVLRDISSRGVCVHHRHRFERGAQFTLHFTSPGGEPLSILCTVAHCARVSATVYSIGAEFAPPATPVAATPAKRGAAAPPPPPSRIPNEDDVERIRRSILD